MTSVPDALNRTGNFSDWLALQPELPDLRSNDGQSRNRRGTHAVPEQYDSRQPASAAGSEHHDVLARCRIFAQIAGAPFVNNYAVNGGTTINGNQWNTREDYYLNERTPSSGATAMPASPRWRPALSGCWPADRLRQLCRQFGIANQSLALGGPTLPAPR